MTIAQLLYNLLISGFALIAFPVVWCLIRSDPRRRAVLAQRLGFDLKPSESSPFNRRKIWIHAVSVGEVEVAQTIVNALDKLIEDTAIVITTTTTTGQEHARKRFGERAAVCYAPVDLWWSTARFLAVHRPDMLICMETEIWPNWIAKAHTAGIASVFLNGRISSRSIGAYRCIRPLLRPVLSNVAAFSMISNADARRIIELGALPSRVRVNGNVKMDAGKLETDDDVLDILRRRYTVTAQTPVFIAGSIRGEELNILMEVYTRLATTIQDLVVIAVPRHIENASRLAGLADARGIRWQYRTQLEDTVGSRQAPMIILDTIGELRSVYGIASVVFCGGSLIPLGGQNVLEPAVWAKPVLFGPSMEDFEEARSLLEASGGGICVKDAEELTELAGHLLTHPQKAQKLGRQARRAVHANLGAAERHARLVADLLEKKKGRH